MTEAQLQHAVIECAHTFGWRVAHFRPAMTAKGWRTPVEADGKGFPDLVLVRRGRLIFAELKSDKGRLSDEQNLWFDTLLPVIRNNPTVHALVWRPKDWLSGEIEQTLRPVKEAA